jgi:hypothetical protein
MTLEPEPSFFFSKNQIDISVSNETLYPESPESMGLDGDGAGRDADDAKT